MPKMIPRVGNEVGRDRTGRASDAGERGSRTAQRFGWGLSALCSAALLLWPGLPLDVVQRKTAAVAAAMAILWLTVALPVAVTSLLPLAFFPALGVLDARAAAQWYMDDLVVLFLGAFLVAIGLERWNLHRRMALFVIAKVGTSPRRLVLGFMLAAAGISAWINNTATALMMLPIGCAVVAALSHGTRAGDALPPGFGTALVLGLAYACSLGGIATPIGTAPNQVFLGIFRRTFPDAPSIGFGNWTLAWAPFVLLFLLLTWWLLTRVYPGVPARRDLHVPELEDERREQGPWGPAQRRMALVFGATVLLWITRADLEVGRVVIPGWGPWLARVQGAGPAAASWASDATVAIAMGALCFAVPSGQQRGEFLLDWRSAARLPWEVLLLIGGGFCLAAGFRGSGLDRVLGELAAPLFSGAPSWAIVAGVVALLTFLTEVTSNTATTNVMLPLLAQTSVAAGIDPRLTMLPATIAASTAFMLPVATPPNAVVYSSGLVSIPVMARAGLALNLATIPILTGAFLTWVAPLLSITKELPAWARR